MNKTHTITLGTQVKGYLAIAIAEDNGFESTPFIDVEGEMSEEEINDLNVQNAISFIKQQIINHFKTLAKGTFEREGLKALANREKSLARDTEAVKQGVSDLLDQAVTFNEATTNDGSE